MLSRFSLDQLQAFVLVLQTGSFSAAAVRLALTQPAVSLQVRELERRLGVRLLERVGRKVAPTAAGVLLLGHANAILNAVDQAAAAVQAQSDSVVGVVRLGTGATACIHLLPPLLKRIRVGHPQLQVVVTTGTADEFVRRVEQNDVDIALVALPVTSRALVVTPSVKEAFVAIGPRDAPRLPKAVSPHYLATRPMVLFEPGGSTRELVERWLLTGGVKARPEMELGSIEGLKEMVAAGLGYSLVPQTAVRPVDRTALQVRPLTPPLLRQLGVIVRADKPLTRGMRVVAEALAKLELPRVGRRGA